VIGRLEGRPEDSELMLRDVPLATIMEYMPDQTGPLFETVGSEKLFNDSNHFHVRFKDGSVLTATGLDECMRFCERGALAISIDRIAWLDMPIFARLAGLEHLAPDTTPLKKAKMVGTIEERSLVALFAQNHEEPDERPSRDHGQRRHAGRRREIDISAGAPDSRLRGSREAPAPHLYIAHDFGEDRSDARAHRPGDPPAAIAAKTVARRQRSSISMSDGANGVPGGGLAADVERMRPKRQLKSLRETILHDRGRY